MPAPSNRRRPVRAAALAALVTAAAALVFAHEGHAPLPSKGVQVDLERSRLALSPEAHRALDVRTADVAPGSVEEALLAYATLAAPWRGHAFAASRLPGRVARLHARPGQVVVPGQVLAEVESLELESLRLELVNARNEVALAGRLLEPLEASVRGGAVPERSLLEARARRRQAENALDVAQSKWASLGPPTGDGATTLPVRSPVGGTVIHADLTVGKLVAAGEHLFEVVDLSTVWVRIGILERDLSRVAPGQRVELTLSAYPGEVFPTTLRAVAPALEPTTHLTTAWAELSNPSDREPRFLPGMTGQARLVLPGPPATRTVPTAAVFGGAADRHVLVEEASAAGGSQFARRPVALGRASAERVEIVGGDLYPGDRVVTRGGHELAGFFVPGILRPTPEAMRDMGLKVEPIRLRPLDSVLEITGAVEVPPDRRAAASPRLPGTLMRVHVDPGQAVRRGQVVAEIASLEFQDLQLELLKAHLDAQLLEDTLGRLRPVGAALPARQLLETEGQFAIARDRRESLRRRLLAVGLPPGRLDTLLADKRLVDALPVVAPIDGALAHFDRVLGEAVRADEPLFTLHDISHVLIRGDISERDLAAVSVGQVARVRLVADPETVIEGRVVRSARVFGVDDRTLAVWVELANAAGRPLRHGQLASLALVRSTAAPTLALPRTAVVREGVRTFAFVHGPNGTFERRAVTTGRTDDRLVEITDGLQADERVAVAGVAALQTAHAGLR